MHSLNKKLIINQSMNYTKAQISAKSPIIQQIIYNHRENQTQSSSEPSFLKLSQKNSQELQLPSVQVTFKQMQNTLQILEKTHIAKIKKVAAQIKKKMDMENERLSFSKNTMKENRQNNCLVYLNLQGKKYEKQYVQQVNFQMDENMNYIKSNIDYHPQTQLYEKLSVSRNSSNQTPKKKFNNCKSSSSCSRTRRRTTLTTCKEQTKRGGRVYEEILSLYSTARLLAMEKQNS